MANEIIMTAAINFMASFLQAVTEFGYAVIAMLFMPFLLPFKSCSVISAFVIVVMGFQMTLMLRKHLDLQIIAVSSLATLASATLGLAIFIGFCACEQG